MLKGSFDSVGRIDADDCINAFLSLRLSILIVIWYHICAETLWFFVSLTAVHICFSQRFHCFLMHESGTFYAYFVP